MVTRQSGQQPAFTAYNSSVKARAPENSTVGYTQLGTFLCPSDSSTSAPSATATAAWATTNYVGNFGGPGIIQRWTGTMIPMKKWSGPPAGPITTASIID